MDLFFRDGIGIENTICGRLIGDQYARRSLEHQVYVVKDANEDGIWMSITRPTNICGTNHCPIWKYSVEPVMKRNTEQMKHQDYQEKVKKQVVKELEELAKRIKNGELVVIEHGSWTAGGNPVIHYKYSLKPKE